MKLLRLNQLIVLTDYYVIKAPVDANIAKSVKCFLCISPHRGFYEIAETKNILSKDLKRYQIKALCLYFIFKISKYHIS